MAKVTIRTMGRCSAEKYGLHLLDYGFQQIFWIAWFSVEQANIKTRDPFTKSLELTPQTSDLFWKLLFFWQQNLGSTKSHHAKTGIRGDTVEMLGNTGTAKDHLQPWCHHPGTESQIVHLHSRMIQSWQLLRPSIRIRVDTLSRCSCSLFRFFLI